MPIERPTIEVKFEREHHNDNTYDVLYIKNKEVLSFNVSNIDELKLEHSTKNIADVVVAYFKESL